MEGLTSYSLTRPRSRLVSDVRRFDWIRRSRAAREGRVGILLPGRLSPSRKSSPSFWRARSRFLAWLRERCSTTRSQPSRSIRFRRDSVRVFFCASERARDSDILKRTSTRVEVLFTFCPPGPELREKENSNSERGILSFPLTARDTISVRSGALILLFKGILPKFSANKHLSRTHGRSRHLQRIHG